MDFAVPVDLKRENKRKQKVRQIPGSCQKAEEKKLCNMKLTVTPVVVCALGTVPKGLEKRLVELKIRRRNETIQTGTLSKSAKIFRRVLEI